MTMGDRVLVFTPAAANHNLCGNSVCNRHRPYHPESVKNQIPIRNKHLVIFVRRHEVGFKKWITVRQFGKAVDLSDALRFLFRRCVLAHVGKEPDMRCKHPFRAVRNNDGLGLFFCHGIRLLQSHCPDTHPIHRRCSRFCPQAGLPPQPEVLHGVSAFSPGD